MQVGMQVGLQSPAYATYTRLAAGLTPYISFVKVLYHPQLTYGILALNIC